MTSGRRRKELSRLLRNKRISRRGNNASPAGSSVGTRKTKYRSVLALLRKICCPASPIILSIRSDKLTKKVLTGDNALDALHEGAEEQTTNECTNLKSGEELIVKVPGINMISELVYGSFGKKIYSFIAENPSEKSPKGFPTGNLTPFDKAWKYYKDQSDDWQDEMSQEANHFRSTRKFTIGFYDLDAGQPIMVEFTRNQANAVVDTIKKYENRLDQFAFELAKTGKGTSTVVSLSLIPLLDDLTDKQRDNFDKLPNDFDSKNFEGLYYEMSDEEQIETLQRVGFDVDSIGLKVTSKGEEDNGEKDGKEIGTDDLPF